MILTVGHGTLEAEAFAALLADAGVGELLDVRRYPGSRRHPWFGRDALAQWLPEAGISYALVEELGGRRRADPDSPNGAWRNAQFAAYADHMATGEFTRGVRRLREASAGATVAVMCSESLWWRCHRRLLADHLVLVEGVPVEHLFHDGRRDGHRPMDEAVLVGDHVEYPPPDGAEDPDGAG